MKQQCQNIQSTKIKIEPDDKPIPDLRTHIDIPNNTANPNSVKKKATKKPKLEDLFICIINADSMMYTNQPERFPATSCKVNKCMMVLVEIDGNYINAEPMKSKTEEGAMIKAFLILWEQLTANRTVKPMPHIMDNKASAEYKKEIHKNCTIQSVLPNNHRQTLAERAIQTFKNHFKAVLASIDNRFSMHLLDRLLPQAMTTLNLLCQTNAVPTISAYQYPLEEILITTKHG
jgi:hypothetical protein